MDDFAAELLATCRLAEEIWEHVPERTPTLRAEVDRLWEARKLALVSGREGIDDDVIALVALSAHLPSIPAEGPLGRTRTEVLLATWRDAEHALSRAARGTLSWHLACRAVEAARQAYHARVDGLQTGRGEDHEDGLIGLDRCASNGSGVPADLPREAPSTTRSVRT